jgi:protein-tyrosine phosphatase
MSHIEIIPGLWLGNQFSTTIFTGNSVLSIGCNPKKSFDNHLKLSLKDSRDSDLKSILRDALKFIDNSLKSNNKILVHCKAGMNRSPAVVIAYLVIYKSYNIDDASQFVKIKKPSIQLHKHYLNDIEEYLCTQNCKFT